ncbi:MAG: cytidine deaminase [Planctomycetes bacterium]|nr:cytidine deaminase [Planctomycetota bacterium]
MSLSAQQRDELVAAARAVRSNAYAPASKFLVGAAVRTADGATFVGCNVENASYGLTVCAERAAVCAAVAAGARRIDAVAIATDLDDPARPCGACRQVLAEFGAAMTVLLVGRGPEVVETTLARLLPEPFTFDGDGSLPRAT